LDGEHHRLQQSAPGRLCCQENKQCHGYTAPTDARAQLHPDVFSFNILLKGFCDENKSQEALDLLCMMANNGSSCAPDVVSYNTIIHGLCKEGQVDNGYNLFVKWRILGLPWMS
jgi:pentatricopeptide repeat protein